MAKVKGFTLLELIVTLAVLALLTGLGAPAMVEWHRQMTASALQYKLLHSIQYARNQAVHRQTAVTLCPGHNNCEDNWGEHILIFTDANHNAYKDHDEILLKTIHLGDSGDRLDWNRNDNYLRFSSQGTSAQTGTLKYCQKKEPSRNFFGIVISRVGRIRLTDEVDCS